VISLNSYVLWFLFNLIKGTVLRYSSNAVSYPVITVIWDVYTGSQEMYRNGFAVERQNTITKGSFNKRILPERKIRIQVTAKSLWNMIIRDEYLNKRHYSVFVMLFWIMVTWFMQRAAKGWKQDVDKVPTAATGLAWNKTRQRVKFRYTRHVNKTESYCRLRSYCAENRVICIYVSWHLVRVCGAPTFL
jgi:hypothetical protein